MLSSFLRFAVLLTVLRFCEVFGSQLRSKYVPSDAVVPPEAWKALNDSVGGRLSAGLPIGFPCYNNFEGEENPTDAAACEVVETNKNNSNWLVRQMSGYTQGSWGVCQSTGAGCPISPIQLVNESAACRQGNIPGYYVDIRTVSDVQHALAFAARYSIPVVVKNSGHDYKGRSAGLNSLALWVRNYTPASRLENDFIPDGCTEPVGDVITFGAGQGFDELYSFADQNNVTIVGGSNEDIAPAGGWITGGGHSALSPVYGLGVDNVQQFRVVLPNGTYVTANHCQNQDIFFALRGGGGGTFGVNMEMSMLAPPQLTLQFVNMTFVDLTIDQQLELVGTFVQHANAWFDDGWGGYAYPARHAAYPSQVFPIQLMNPRLSRSEAETSLGPLIALAESLNITYDITTYDSFYDLYASNIRGYLAGFGNYGLAEASRLIPRSHFEEGGEQEKLARTLVSSVTETYGDIPLTLMLLLVAPSRKIPDSDSAITPAWRRSTWHVISLATWDPSTVTPEQTEAIYTALTQSMQELRAMTPDGGAYLNEGDVYEPDPDGAFWGDEYYQRLLRIKQSVDPQNIMQVYQGIGSDSSSPLFRCYPPNPNSG